MVTGLVVNARPETADGERALGLFLNTVPLRVQTRGGTWRELVAQVFAEETRALPYRSYPMAEIQRVLGGSPILHTAFNYVHFHAYDALARLGQLELLGQSGVAETDFPLAASFSRDVATGAVRLSLECAARSIDRAAVERIAGYYVRTLQAIAAGPDARCDACSPMDAAERGTLDAWSRGARTTADPRLAHERVADHARSRPDAIAVVTSSGSLTYGELDARSTAVAHVLRARGVTVESRVALLSAASPDLVVAMLAAWKAGAAFVPLDPSYPAERLRFMLRDARPALMLAERDLASVLEGEPTPLVRLEDIVAGTPGRTGELPGPDADRLAYVIYTSGSTGSPKGVMATHGGLRNLLHGQIPRFDLTPSSRVLQFAALGFDAAVSEIFTTLAAGATLVLAPRADLRVPDRVVAWLRDRAITTVTLPPALLTSMPDETLPALRTIVSAGESCRDDLVRRWAGDDGSQRIRSDGNDRVRDDERGARSRRPRAADRPSARQPRRVGARRAFAPSRPASPASSSSAATASRAATLGRPELTAERFVAASAERRPRRAALPHR